MLFKQSLSRIPTGQLNRLIATALERHPPPLFQHRRPKIYYATQVGSQPPTIVLVCNEPKAFPHSYRRYLLGVLRDQLTFGEVPIKLYLKKRASTDQRDELRSHRAPKKCPSPATPPSRRLGVCRLPCAVQQDPEDAFEGGGGVSVGGPEDGGRLGLFVGTGAAAEHGTIRMLELLVRRQRCLGPVRK